MDKEKEAREESVIFTRDEERERMVDQMRDAAVKARQDYEALKKEYDWEAPKRNMFYLLPISHPAPMAGRAHIK